MTSLFDIVYPGKGRIDFDGGLNNKFDRQIIADNESPDCQNVIFGKGSVETRGGTTQLNTASVGTFAADGLYTRSDNSGTESMVAWWGGSLYDLQGTSFITIGSAQAVYTAGVRVAAAEYENHMFFGNGNSIPYKYDGVDFTRHGIYAPTETSTVGTSPTGSVLTGDYQYKVTYINSQVVEGDVGPTTDTFTAAGENATITSLPVAPQSFGVAARNIYRTEASGTVFKFLDTISDNTTTTYDDGIADSGLGTVAPTDNGVPPNFSAIVYHQSRLFMVDPQDNFVKYTPVGNPYVVNALSFRRIGDVTGDIPQALTIFDNSIYVFCKKSTWLIYMPSTDDSTWIDVRVKSPYGSHSPFAPFFYNNRVMFPAVQNSRFVGFAAVSGDTVDPNATLLTVSGAGSDMKSDKIEPDMLVIQDAVLGNYSATVFENKAYISVTYGAGETVNNRIYVFDFSIENLGRPQKFSWVPWTGLNATQMTVYDGKLFYADANETGLVYQMNTEAYDDNGSAIDSYYWTKEFAGGDSDDNWLKDFRFANILYEQSGDWMMNLTVRVNSDSGDGNTSSIDLNPGGTLWTTFNWDEANWGGGDDENELKKFLGQLRGKRIQFKFDNQNAVAQKFKIIGLNYVYNKKGRR